VKNLNITQLYNKINKSILLLEAHTEIKNLSFIIKACRLTPWITTNNNLVGSGKIVIYSQWIDEFNNSVEIDKKNKICITYNNLRINSSYGICTDLYAGLPLFKIIKISKLMHLYIGYDDNKIFCCITLVGIDNFFRTYIYQEHQWIQVSPLVLNVTRLFQIHDHLDIKFFLKFHKKNNIFFPCETGEEWISFLPASEKFITTLAKKYDTNMFDFLTTNKDVCQEIELN